MTRLFSSALLPLAMLAFMTTTLSADVVMFEDFEDTLVNYTVTQEFHDGDNDYFTIVPLNGAISIDDGPYSGFAGSNFFGAEDIDDNGGPGTDSQTLVFTMDITGYTDLTFDMLFAAGANEAPGADPFFYDSPDGVRVTAQIDGGSIQNLLAFESDEGNGAFNSQLRIDSDFDGVGDAGGFAPTAAFSSFSGISIAGTGTTLVINIEVFADAANEEFAFDNITVQATSVPEPSAFTVLAGLAGIAVLRRRRRLPIS